MNLIWHIARKDLHRFWVPLTLFCAVALMRFGAGISLLASSGSDAAWFYHMAIYANVLWGIELVVTYMLVAGVVQEDSVASLAFWQTRPISGSRLLAAKALGLVLMFGVLPVVLTVPWWLGCGFGWAEIGRAAVETFAVQMSVALLALPWAAVTSSYGRFLLWTFVAAVAWVTGAIVFIEHVTIPHETIPPWTGVMRLLVTGLAAGVGCVAVAVHQFVTRRTPVSVALILLTALAMAGVGGWWTWDGSALWSPARSAPNGIAKDVGASLQEAYAYVASPENNSFAQVNVKAGPVPSHYVLSPYYSDQRLRWGDGSVTRQAHFEMWGWQGQTSTWAAYDQLGITPEPRDRNWTEFARRRYLIRESEPDSRQASRYIATFSLTLSPETVRRFRREKPEYDATLGFRLLRPEVIGEHDPRVGTVFAKGSTHSRVALVDRDEAKQVAWISFIERSPEFLWADFLSLMELAPWNPEPAYGLVNRERTRISGALNEARDHALVAEVSIVLRKDGFRGHNRWNHSVKRWEHVWESLTDATLAEVTFKDAGRFSLPLKVESFTMSGVAKHGSIGSCTVSGEVNKPGNIGLTPGTTLAHALQAVGGVSDRADLSAVVITRVNSNGSSTRIVANVDAWLRREGPTDEDIVLQPGDIVDVPASSAAQRP
ncbi:MAG TPA: SLBB domain-containing protein [Dongiaceae bacterium]|nr:SLBB domain-containing protein [Dongiaceae bacterium]